MRHILHLFILGMAFSHLLTVFSFRRVPIISSVVTSSLKLTPKLFDLSSKELSHELSSANFTSAASFVATNCIDGCILQYFTKSDLLNAGVNIKDTISITIIAEAKFKEDERLAEDERKNEEAKLKEDERLAEEERKEEEAKRKEDERIAEEERKEEEAKRKEDERSKKKRKIFYFDVRDNIVKIRAFVNPRELERFFEDFDCSGLIYDRPDGIEEASKSGRIENMENFQKNIARGFERAANRAICHQVQLLYGCPYRIVMEGVEIKNASQSKILLAEIDGLLMAADLNGEAMVPAFVVETKLQLEPEDIDQLTRNIEVVRNAPRDLFPAPIGEVKGVLAFFGVKNYTALDLARDKGYLILKVSNSSLVLTPP